MGNTNYTVSGPNYTAFAIEQVLKRDWTFQLTSACALIAAIKDRDLTWRKGFKVSGAAALIPIVHTEISTFTSSNIGVADADEIPAAWPTWDATEGFSQAKYDYTHMRRSMTLKASEQLIAAGGARGDIKSGKLKQLMAKFKSLACDMIEGGSDNASRTKLMGIPYAIATANSPGGIDQSTSAYWRGRVNSVAGALSRPVIDNEYDAICRAADETGETDAPDLLMLAFNGTGVNCFGAMRNLLSPNERYFHKDYHVKYGIKTFDYMGMKCAQGNRMPDGTAYMLSTQSWYWGGMEHPKELEPQRILGSDAQERFFTWWAFLGCGEPRRNSRMTGITG